ncbi:hypothetical protein [Corynebacterium freneyi]|uniref:Uncharacterized protein n=1 Tax=Corynebacterium freneyi DNF00450 TaxID=1287475 RepID=A0A095Y4K1_9CORY|nr:hypothetical protein [Corynebacterium freneyi]KGF16986.1 hypothetical protein HMPREF1650_05975 [Corynebacterium freneyi DNF00450]
MKNAITAFVSPSRRELLIGFAAIAFFLAVGRFAAGSGFTWNMLALMATAVLFGIAAHRVRAVRALDVPATTWFAGFASVAAAWSLALAAVATASTWLSWRNSPWYTLYDSFVVTAGSAPFTDTNGEPYLVDDAGTAAWTWATTLLVFLVCFLMAAAIGAALGTVTASLGVVTAIAGASLAIAVLLAATWGFGIGDGVAAPYPGVFIFGIPIAAVAAPISWAAANTLEP